MNESNKIVLTIFLLIISFHLLSQTKRLSPTDTSSYSYKTIKIHGEKFKGFLNREGFYLMNSKNKILLKQKGGYFTWYFRDLINDGHKDIVLERSSNTPEVFELLAYIPMIHSFKPIKDFEHFPAPVKIHGTKYYYSYHKSGCADADWDSDLFYISNYKAIRIGNISGRQCKNSGIKDGVYINKVHYEKKILLKTFPIEIINKYKEDKWGFIKDYWNKNYNLFL